MCSYNRVNGTRACENGATIGALKEDLGFLGWVISDWGGTHSTIPSALAGLDLSMPDGQYFGDPLAAAIKNGSVPMSRLDDMVQRILTPLLALGLQSTPASFSPSRNQGARARSPAHDALARTIAEASIVLLRNDGTLPLPKDGLKSVLVLGDEGTIVGEGSGGVNAPYMAFMNLKFGMVFDQQGNLACYHRGLDPRPVSPKPL